MKLDKKKPSGWVSWNPWHGCHKISTGCKHCYMYRSDERYGIDSSVVAQTKNFDLPVKKKRDGSYKLLSESSIATCFTSDFFIEEADIWRADAWDMIRQRQDLRFFMITKRPDRFFCNLPEDWEKNFDHVSIGCTVENQDRAAYRLPIFMTLPIKNRVIVCEPLLEKIDLAPYINQSVLQVVAGGESGPEARICDYDWILSLRDTCQALDISFWFKQTGARFIKDGKLYNIRKSLQHSQARKANINIHPATSF